ncbi:MAG: class I SAM-dependent methyltransferase [Flavobacterium sp.]|nr:MAG: class I SAM-dependent methyltransferase [Flavobacterium sp.]
MLYASKKLISYVWDGETKHKEVKYHTLPHIWSSATLYPKEIRLQREKWFNEWLKSSKNFLQSDVIDFHKNAGKDDIENGLVMQRASNLATVSITSVEINVAAINMRHENLISDELSELKMPIRVSNDKLYSLNKWQLKLKTAGIKLSNWEYWPMHLVYAPMYFYWFYLSAKARSLFFFSAANPSRKNAGFAMENKSDTYQFLPQQYYPKTVIYKPNTKAPALKERLKEVVNKYRAADYFTEGYSYDNEVMHLDISNMSNINDDSYDLLIAIDVLEHVYDDKKALEEINRVLRPGGITVLSVPQKDNTYKTFEDHTITDPIEREKHFGQFDHVRMYGEDFKERIEAAGFKVEIINEKSFPNYAKRYVLSPPEKSNHPLATNYRKIYVGYKN